MHRDDTRAVGFAARLAPSRGAGGVARGMVRSRLGDLMTPATLDDVLLVVSELVTNAVRHGRGDVDLRIEVDGGRVTGHVSDEGEGFTRRVHTAPADDGGHRGLLIVEQLADDWGIQGESAHVWFAIAGEPVAGAAP